MIRHSSAAARARRPAQLLGLILACAEDIGRYYRAYAELMAHWDAVLPGTVLRVQHEELVEDLEHHVRRILDFVGLDL